MIDWLALLIGMKFKSSSSQTFSYWIQWELILICGDIQECASGAEM